MSPTHDLAMPRETPRPDPHRDRKCFLEALLPFGANDPAAVPLAISLTLSLGSGM